MIYCGVSQIAALVGKHRYKAQDTAIEELRARHADTKIIDKDLKALQRHLYRTKFYKLFFLFLKIYTKWAWRMFGSTPLFQMNGMVCGIVAWCMLFSRVSPIAWSRVDSLVRVVLSVNEQEVQPGVIVGSDLWNYLPQVHSYTSMAQCGVLWCCVADKLYDDRLGACCVEEECQGIVG